MTDSKVFVFGSFTEDETRSLLLKQSAGNAEKPVEKKELQFGSLNFAAAGSLGGANGDLSYKPSSTNRPVGFLSSTSPIEDGKSRKTATDHSSTTVQTPKEMEALLSCSPFVQLLQQLRLRNTPKEDAQEFLSFIMDQMHDELIKLQGQSGSSNGVRSSLVSSVEDDEWETVGPKSKSAVTRTQIPSLMFLEDRNKTSATVQPFLLLHLDIHPEAVHTVEDALHLFSAPEYLEGYCASTAGKIFVCDKLDIIMCLCPAGWCCRARKSLKIQTLSKIMILHLMRFSYGNQRSSMLHKPVHFPLELVLGRELLVCPSPRQHIIEKGEREKVTFQHFLCHIPDSDDGEAMREVRYPAVGGVETLHKAQALFILFFTLFSTCFITINGEFSRQSIITSRKRMEKMTRLHFYFHDIVDRKNPTAMRIIRPPTKSAGSVGTFHGRDPLTEKPEPTSKLVGRAQGIYALASQHDVGLLMVMNFALSEELYNGNALSIIGRNAVLNMVREMPVVGGRGIFLFARYALAKTVWFNQNGDALVEYNVSVVHY
ncbi:hypothetical protein CRYUN_Cryun09bG0117500 [Craigia yunnanensis]